MPDVCECAVVVDVLLLLPIVLYRNTFTTSSRSLVRRCLIDSHAAARLRCVADVICTPAPTTYGPNVFDGAVVTVFGFLILESYLQWYNNYGRRLRCRLTSCMPPNSSIALRPVSLTWIDRLKFPNLLFCIVVNTIRSSALRKSFFSSNYRTVFTCSALAFRSIGALLVCY